MEMMAGEPLWAVKMSKLEQKRVQNEKLQMLSQIHRIHNDKYGYKQSGLYESWYEAIYNMVLNLVNDCNRLGYETSNGRQLIKYIDLYKDILRKVPCCMVNFDLWDSNVLYNEGQLVWIDPERSFWGNPIGDFITQGKGQKATLDEKKQEIEVYNQTAEVKLSVGREERIRYAIMVAYLALIEEVEKYVRYEPEDENYIRNTVDAKDMYDMAYSVLESSRKINMIRSTLSNKK